MSHLEGWQPTALMSLSMYIMWLCVQACVSTRVCIMAVFQTVCFKGKTNPQKWGVRSIFPCLIGCRLIWFRNSRHDIPLSWQYRPTRLSIWIWRKACKKKGSQTDGQTDDRRRKVKRVELGLDFKVLGRYDCSSHLRSGWGERKNLRGSSHHHMPHLPLWFGDFCPEAMFWEEQEGVWGGGVGWTEKREGRQGQKERSQEKKKKKKKMGGWVAEECPGPLSNGWGVTMATVMKGLRTPWGDWGGGALAGVEVGEGRVMVKRMGGAEIESWRGRKRPAGFLFFLRSDKLTMLTHIMLQCCHGNVLYDVLLTFTDHIILCKLFRKSTTLVGLQGWWHWISISKMNKNYWMCYFE